MPSLALLLTLIIPGQAEATNDLVTAKLEVYPTEIYWGDPVYLRVTWVNPGEHPIEVPDTLDEGLGTIRVEIGYFNTERGRSPFSGDPWGSGAYGEFPLLVLKPGEERIVARISGELPAVDYRHEEFWQKVDAEATLEIRVQVKDERIGPLPPLAQKITLHPRPGNEQAWLEELIAIPEQLSFGPESAELSPRKRGVVARSGSFYLHYLPLHYIGRRISEDRYIFDAMLEREAQLAPSTLRNAIHSFRLWREIEASLTENVPSQRRAIAKYLTWLDTLPDLEAAHLAKQMRIYTHGVIYSKTGRDNVAMKSLDFSLERGMETGSYVEK